MLTTAAYGDPPPPPPIREALLLLLRVARRVASALLGGVGVYGLLCAAWHSGHWDAAGIGAACLALASLASTE